MSEIKYLKNAATGVVYVYSDMLFAKQGMIPCDIDGKITPEITQAAADQRVVEAGNAKTEAGSKKQKADKKVV